MLPSQRNDAHGSAEGFYGNASPWQFAFLALAYFLFHCNDAHSSIFPCIAVGFMASPWAWAALVAAATDRLP